MPSYAQLLSPNATPQSEPIPDKKMVENSAGGYAFQAGDWERLNRFLVLGSATPTYYATARKLTVENAACVLRCAATDATRAVDTIVAISTSGRAPKNDPAVFALTLVASQGTPEAKALALAAMSAVCRTGTHLFSFAEAVNSLRGWGRALRRSVAAWYTDKAPDALAYQLVKYQSRNGWSHRDLLRLAHVHGHNSAALRWVIGAENADRAVVRKRAVNGKPEPLRTDAYPAPTDGLPPIIEAFERAKTATTPAEIVALIRERGLTREMVPTQFLTDAGVWEALLDKMPLTAMVRNLGNLSKCGLLAPLSEAERTVKVRLADADRLRKARVHPLALLVALNTYATGKGVKGSGEWPVVQSVADALNDAFYLAFQTITPTGKRWLLGVDVSGSMDGGEVAGMTGITPRIGAAAMSLVTAATEPLTHAVAFTSNGAHARPSMHRGYPSGISPLAITPRMRMNDVVQTMKALPMGGTDCALPMLYATEAKIPVDVFVVYTDNETWAGNIHPAQALVAYRQKMGIDAKLIVVGFTATDFTIADPSDAGMLDVVGFDTAAPAIMGQFVGGPVAATETDD